MNALTPEEKSQYTFEFYDNDNVKRYYPRFIPDADENDIRTQTNPVSADTNSDSVIDGCQDKNKNGRYLDGSDDPEEGESDAVFGFYVASEAKRNLSYNGTINIYPPVLFEYSKDSASASVRR